ncbi:hypothetical protein FGG08_006256 [Glutinoglossum americanum]|uniref:JmjC domain-containing histone demethylation protein 1 n=1 Tax=Glutinoglossum americanum TaxID=1670608 RepID=A0A9P8HT02_9PEZI|nr:hypothetical protein FGG08_006256 [Glutinoglossum americanum]
MAKSTSKRFKDLRGRPLDYRTPSPPPRSAIEDIPPLTPPTQGIFNTSFVRTKLNGRTKRAADGFHKGTNYRTPSPPPRSAIEAISPLTPVRPTVDISTSAMGTKNRRIAQSTKSGQNGHSRRGRAERRGVQDGSRWNTRGGGDETEGEEESCSVPREDRGRLAAASNLAYDKNGVGYHANAQPTHHFSSAMDAIATIAMATSPTFGPQSHQLPSAFLQSHYPSQYPTSQFLPLSVHHSSTTHTLSEERPSKRARPDNPSDVSAQESQRPQINFSNSAVWVQSYSQQTAWNSISGPVMSLPQRRQTNVSDSDAELLLNVGRVAVFAKPPVPKLIKQTESNESGRLGMAFASSSGIITGNWVETSSPFRSVEKSAESGSVVHHSPNAIGANGTNPISHATGGNEVRGLNGGTPLLTGPDSEAAQAAAVGSHVGQDLPTFPKSRDPLEINEDYGTMAPPLAITDQSSRPRSLSTNGGSSGGFGQEDSGRQSGWPNGTLDVGKQHLETLAQKPHLDLGSSATSPTVEGQQTFQGSNSPRVEAGENASEFVGTPPEHERQDALSIPSHPDGHITNGVEASEAETVNLPQERDMIGDAEMAFIEPVPLHLEHGMTGDARATSVPLHQGHDLVGDVGIISTETISLPHESEAKGDIRGTSTEAVPLPHEQDVIGDVRAISPEAASLTQEHDVIDTVETASITATPSPQEKIPTNTVETTSTESLPLLGEHGVMGVIKSVSSEKAGAPQKHTLISPESSFTEAPPLSQEHMVNAVKATTSVTYPGGAGQSGLVDVNVDDHTHAKTPEGPTAVSDPDGEAIPPITDMDGGVAPGSQVEVNRNGPDDGGQGFIQELREFVKRSTGEKAGTQGTDSPAAETTPAPDPLEDGNLAVETQSDEAESTPLQATPAEPSHMVRGESQSSESKSSSKQLRRGWPKGKPRGPRSSWPGVIKAKEGIKADDKSGPFSRANRSAGRKENQNEGSTGSQQLMQKKLRAGVTRNKPIEDSRPDVPMPYPWKRVEAPSDGDSNASIDIRSQNTAARHSTSPNKDTLINTQDIPSRNGSPPQLHQLWQEDAHPSASVSLKESDPSPLNDAQVSLRAAATASLSSLDSGDIQSPLASIATPTLTQTSENRRPLHHHNSVPDSLIDPLLLASGSEDQSVGRSDVLPPTRAFSTPLGNGQDFTDQNPETKGSVPGREDLSAEAEQSVCAGCSMLPNSLGGDSYLETISWIKCDGCKRWFHYACAGFTEKEVRGVDKFSCTACWDKCGPTTFVRKSSRAHTSIDYAGLHEGVVKTSEESLDHPYVKPIKDGTIKFLPESFARLRPEAATREFFERKGMTEPVVIPASMNPRPDTAPDVDKLCCDHSEGESQVFIKQAIDYWLAGDFDKLHGPNHGQDTMDMVIPQNLTVRKVSQLYGPAEKVEVINVKSQGEDGPWNMKKWADYYESDNKQFIRNVISLEISTSELGRLVKRPQVVRDMDLVDSVWPADLRARGDFPKVQLYCLMSVENSFTDFHIDFGGSSVFYHILKGKKTFLFIPPKPKHLKKYEQWCLSPAQNQTFLPDQTKECIRIDLSAGDTMLIPSGWIHAVWTPEDSLVIGGNFLTRMHYGMQISIAEIEKNTKVPRKFRYPSFQRVLWFTAIRYLKDDPVPLSLVEKFNYDEVYRREIPLYQDFNNWGVNSMSDAEAYNLRYYSQAELDGLPSLVSYLLRTALISIGKITDGITVDARQRVTRAIPKGYGDALEIAKGFAMWSAWKRGNEPIPHWAYRNAVPGEGIAGVGEKKLSAAAIKRLEREAAAQEMAPGRQSMRKRAQMEAATLNEVNSTTPDFGSGPDSPLTATARKPQPKAIGDKRAKTTTASGLRLGDVDGNLVPIKPIKTPKTSVLGPKRVACDECRKRRVRCKHKDLLEPDEPEVERSSMTRNTTPRSEANKDIAPPAQSLLDTNSQNISPPNSDPQQTQPPITLGAPSDSLIPNQQTPARTVSATPVPSGPSGKHRACEKCRKNRRRCIHDGNGNVDPIKAQEPPMPRASSSNKRARPVIIGTVDTNRYFKKTKLEPEITSTFSNISESLTDVIRVRPGIPDPLRSFDISAHRQKLAAEIAGRRALDTEKRFPYMTLAMPSTLQQTQRKEPNRGGLQQLPNVPTVLVDASERQLLREEASRIDKEVGAESGVQMVIQHSAAPIPSAKPQGAVMTSPPDSRTNANTNANSPDASRLISTPLAAPTLNMASAAEINPGNAINWPNSTSSLKSGQYMVQGKSQHIGGRLTDGPTITQETTPYGPRSEREQSISKRVEIENVGTKHVNTKIGQIKLGRGETEVRKVEPEHRKPETEHAELKRTEAEMAQTGSERREMETGHIDPGHEALGFVQTVPEGPKLEIGQVSFKHSKTDTAHADPDQREARASSIHERQEARTVRIEAEHEKKDQAEAERMDAEPVEPPPISSELANEQTKTELPAQGRAEQGNLQSNDRATERADARQAERSQRAERDQSYPRRKELELADHGGAEAELSSSEKLELDSSTDDLSSPPDSPLSELDMSSPEPDPGAGTEPKTKAESQAKTNPQEKGITPKSPSPSPEQHRRRSKRETKGVQRFSAASTTGSYNKHRPNGREASRTPAPHMNYKSMSPNLEFPSPGKTYARKSGRPVITPCKTAPLSRPGSIFAAGDDASLAAHGAGRGKTPFLEGGSAADDEEKISEVDEESWRLAKEMEFGLRRKGLK